jgi:hypothetical protein
VRDRLFRRGQLPLKEWLAAKETANQLVIGATRRLGEIAQGLFQQIGTLGKGFVFQAVGGQTNAYDNVRAATVQHAGQVADFGEYNAVVRLLLQAGRPDELALSFHGIGPRYRGLVGVVAYLSVQGSEPRLIDGGSFQINYEEDAASAQKRFSSWLEGVIVHGLKQWRRTL